jgi:hypothetical protein
VTFAAASKAFLSHSVLSKPEALIAALMACASATFTRVVIKMLRESVPVREVFQGKTIWNGEVEVFDLTGHPKAKRAYGWSHPEGDDNKGERFVTVLEIPPVSSAETAVKVSIVSDLKK